MAEEYTCGTLIRHQDKIISSPITDENGTFTTCKSLEEIIGYLGFNWEEEELTKAEVLEVIGHPVMIKNFLDITDIVGKINAFGWVSITRDSFPPVVGYIDFLFGAEERSEELEEYVGRSTADAQSENHVSEPSNLLGAGFWHWAEDLKQLREYNNGRIDPHEIRAIYARLDAVKPGMLNGEFRTIRPTQWPIGLQHGMLTGDGETKFELFNRLWQLFWFMREEVFEASCQKKWKLPGHEEDEYGTDTPGAHSPLWWT